MSKIINGVLSTTSKKVEKPYRPSNIVFCDNETAKVVKPVHRGYIRSEPIKFKTPELNHCFNNLFNQDNKRDEPVVHNKSNQINIDEILAAQMQSSFLHDEPVFRSSMIKSEKTYLSSADINFFEKMEKSIVNINILKKNIDNNPNWCHNDSAEVRRRKFLLEYNTLKNEEFVVKVKSPCMSPNYYFKTLDKMLSFYIKNESNIRELSIVDSNTKQYIIKRS